jgi:hypothetical protein
MQQAILAALKKDGRASTRTLFEAVEVDLSTKGKKLFPESFYRGLSGLESKGLISWYQGCGGHDPVSGLVSITRKRVLLIDADSTIPNLPLMEISSWHKKQGHDVTLQKGLKTNKEK